MAQVERSCWIPIESPGIGIMFGTSGTTGFPKKFYLTDAQMTLRVKRRVLKPGLANLKSLLCLLSPIHTAGKTYETWCVNRGVRFLHPVGSIPVMQIAESESVEGIVGNPRQLMRLAEYTGTYRFKWVLSSGGLVTPLESKMIRARLGRNFHSSYGASETGTVAVASGEQLESVPNCLGVICGGNIIQIDQNGWLAVKTPAMIEGYVDPNHTRQSFIDGWFHMGDQVKMVHNMLVWTGTKRR